MVAALRPLRLPGFPNLGLAYFVNELGNWLGEIALAVLVFYQTGDPMAVAALFCGIHFAPALLGLNVGTEADIENRKTHHDDELDHDHDEFESFVVPLPEIDDPGALSKIVSATAEAAGVLRIKGFAAVRDKCPALAHVVMFLCGIAGKREVQLSCRWRARHE